MSEQTHIQKTPTPRTRASLTHDLLQLGLRPNTTLLVHSSLRSLGWVSGGPVAVVQALMDVITPQGTLVMPTHSANNSDPAQWENPPVPQEWWPIIYEHMPAFDLRLTPSYFMGQIVEVFRNVPGTQRSYHPAVSFSAWGKHVEHITAHHDLHFGMGEGSPLARLYELDALVLLLGVDYNSNSSFHLAEYRVPDARPEIAMGASIFENGTRVWKTYRDLDIDSDVFPEIGALFEETNAVTHGQVGSASCKLFNQRAAVDFAVNWYQKQQR